MKANIVVECDNKQEAIQLLTLLNQLTSRHEEEFELNQEDIEKGQFLNLLDKIAYIEDQPVRKTRKKRK